MDGAKQSRITNIETSDGHSIYVEESGQPDGIPILFLHGGPGAGIGTSYQWLFLRSLKYRVIAFDQRGCGKSKPFAELENNTTTNLIEDIEQIRQHFNIEKWVVFGGSWGSTLALVYSIFHPNQVTGLILRGIFLDRKDDANWFTSANTGASQVFPQEYLAFTQNIENTNEIIPEFFKKLTSHNQHERDTAAKQWFDWEGAISKLNTDGLIASEHASDQQIYSLALLECYYLMNGCFINENFILENCDKIQHIPTHIVHGRYDMVCKCEAAVALHKSLPNSILTIVNNAGHSMTEPGISSALIDCLDKMYVHLK